MATVSRSCAHTVESLPNLLDVASVSGGALGFDPVRGLNHRHDDLVSNRTEGVHFLALVVCSAVFGAFTPGKLGCAQQDGRDLHYLSPHCFVGKIKFR